MKLQLGLTLPREELSVPLTRHVVSAALLTAGVEPTCVHDVEVAVSEACTNAVKHAVEGVSYEVVVSIGQDTVSIDVVDSGAGFGQHRVTLDGHDHWAEDGRGLALMTALTDLAIFDTVDGEGGSVRLTKRLRWIEGEHPSGVESPSESQQRRPDEA